MTCTPAGPAKTTLWDRLKAIWNAQVAKLTRSRDPANGAQFASSIFAAASVAVAIGGFAAVLYQVSLIKNNAAVASARQVFMEYSKTGIKYPALAFPDYDKLKAGDAMEFKRYRLFVTLMLWAYDEMLLVYDDPEWQSSFENDIRAHMEYLCKETKRDDFLALSKQMRTLLIQARARWVKDRPIAACLW